MRVITEQYTMQGSKRWRYELVNGRAAKSYVLSTASGFYSQAEAQAAGDTLVASLVMRAMVKKAQGVGRRAGV